MTIEFHKDPYSGEVICMKGGTVIGNIDPSNGGIFRPNNWGLFHTDLEQILSKMKEV